MPSVPPAARPAVERADVLVVGARCAGAATALLLARAGLRVVVLERANRGADTLSTHALLRTGVLQLHRWGLLDTLRAAGTPVVHRTVFRYGRDETTVEIRPDAGVDGLYAPRRTLLDPLLSDAASAAGADVRFGWTVTGLRRDGTGTVTGVDATDPSGRARHIAARLTIGADGVRSRVARWTGAPVERLATATTAVVYAHVAAQRDDAYEFFYERGAAAGVMPTDGGEACVYVGVPPERFRSDVAPDARAGFLRVLAEVAPAVHEHVAASGGPAQVRSFPGTRGFLRRPFGPGWALVGDAGYFKDPLTAHGMSDAFRDAELLARAVVGAGDRAAALPAALSEYQRTRDRLSLDLFAATEAVASFAWDTTTIGPLLRAVSAATRAEVDVIASLPPLGSTGSDTGADTGAGTAATPALQVA